LDEADRMLDMGFIVDIRRIMKALPAERQTLLFSATFSNDIKALADDLLNDPTLIEVDPSNTAAEQVTQRIIQVDRERRRELLSHMIGRGNWQRVLVFVRTKQIADRLAQQMQKDGLNTVAIHGDKSQGARNRALADFRSGEVRVLVATDIAARGLDIDQLPYVINFELPQMAEDYIHRIGRTGRAGRGGEAISLVSQDELGQLKAIEALIGQSLSVEILEGYEPSGKPSRQTLPGSKPVQNPPRARGHANAKSSNAKGKPAAGKGKAKGDASKNPAQSPQNKSRKREVVGEDIGFAPMRRLPKAMRDSYQESSDE
ncbi:MAG: DEAD/DEAH box helicase, partial [Aeromonas veronii]